MSHHFSKTNCAPSRFHCYIPSCVEGCKKRRSSDTENQVTNFTIRRETRSRSEFVSPPRALLPQFCPEIEWTDRRSGRSESRWTTDGVLEPESHLAPTIFACGINPESVDALASLSDHEVARAFPSRVCRSWVPSLPRCSEKRRPGARGDRAAGRTLKAMKLGGPLSPFREHLGEFDP